MPPPGTPTSARTGALLVGAPLAWLSGLFLQLQQAALWPTPHAATVLVTATVGLAACAAASKRTRGAGAWALLGAAAMSLAALAWASTSLRATARLADALPAALEGRDVRVTGVVASLPQQGSSGLRFRFEVESARELGSGTQPSVALPGRVMLGWYKGFHEDAVLSQPQRELAAGQRWQFTLRLRQPHGNLNPGGFDSELQAFEQGIRAVGYVRDAPPPLLLDRAAGYSVERWRQRVRDGIESTVDNRRLAGVLAALAVGDQSAIEREDWELFRTTGIAHLVSISGLHVTMFAWLAGLAVAAAWRRSRRAMTRLPAPLAGLWGGLLAALAYAVCSGWGVPAQRTVWMLACVTLVRASGARWPWPPTLLAAAVVVTAVDPWALLQPGFWLSFAAVGLLLASGGAADDGDGDRESEATAAGQGAATAGWRRHAMRVVDAARGGVRTQLIATLGLAPLTLVFFQQLSLVGMLANLVAIPLVTLVVTPLALLGALAWPLWLLAAWALTPLVVWLQWLAAWPQAVWWAPVAPWWAQCAGLIAAVLLVVPWPWRLRVLALPLVLPLLLPPPRWPPHGVFELLAADVGQGTAVLVRTRGHLLVYDAGPQYSRDSDAGERLLLPLLRSRGETRIDHLMLSHRDTDHTGGAAALQRGLPVAAWSGSLEDLHPLRVDAAARGMAPQRCQAGQRWRWDGVDFTVLAPAAADYALPLRPNAMSCVLRVQAGGVSALLTGDIEQAQEAALVAADAGALRSTVLLVPHHGSKTSSTSPFIDAVAPRVAVFQAGYRSRFGHPAPEVVARYAQRGIALRVSPACGAWRWRSDAPAGAEADATGGPGGCERERGRRYWHHRQAAGPAP